MNYIRVNRASAKSGVSSKSSSTFFEHAQKKRTAAVQTMKNEWGVVYRTYAAISSPKLN